MCIWPPVLFLRYHTDLSEVSFPAVDCLSPCDWLSLRNFLFITLAPFCLLNLCKLVSKLLQSPCNHGWADNAGGCRQPGRASPGNFWKDIATAFPSDPASGSRMGPQSPLFTRASAPGMVCLNPLCKLHLKSSSYMNLQMRIATLAWSNLLY